MPFGAGDGRSYCLAISDLNGDALPDLVVGNVQQPNAAFFSRAGGAERRELRFGPAEHATYGLAVGDLDGDGYPDIVTANSDGPNVVYRNVAR